MGRWTQVHVFQTGSQNAATPYPRDNPAPPPPGYAPAPTDRGGSLPGWRRQRLIRDTLPRSPGKRSATGGGFWIAGDAVFAMRPAWQAKGWASGMIEVLAWYGRVYGAARKAEKNRPQRGVA